MLSTGSAEGSGTGPGTNFSGGEFGSRDEISAALCVSSKPQTESRVWIDERAVALEPRRPRVAGDLRADGARPGRDRVPDPSLRAEAAELALQVVQPSRLHHAASRTVPARR